jgi:hypothetical protein
MEKLQHFKEGDKIYVIERNGSEKHDKGKDEITIIVVISSDSVLPIDAAMKVYESETAITIKRHAWNNGHRP